MAEKSSGGLRTNLEVSYVPRYENCGEVSIIGSDKWFVKSLGKITLCFGDQKTSLSLEIRKLKCTFRRNVCVRRQLAFPRVLVSTWKTNLDGDCAWSQSRASVKAGLFTVKRVFKQLRYGHKATGVSESWCYDLLLHFGNFSFTRERAFRSKTNKIPIMHCTPNTATASLTSGWGGQKKHCVLNCKLVSLFLVLSLAEDDKGKRAQRNVRLSSSAFAVPLVTGQVDFFNCFLDASFSGSDNHKLHLSAFPN